jgi:hypothetical protein
MASSFSEPLVCSLSFITFPTKYESNDRNDDYYHDDTDANDDINDNDK